MEMRSAVKNCLGIFRDLVVENIVGFIHRGLNRIRRADTDTASAADTLVMIDGTFTVGDFGCIMRTDRKAFSAADTSVRFSVRFARGMHLHFAGTGTASHTDVLQRTAEARTLMTLEMVERNEDIGIHDRASDLRFFDIFAAVNGHTDLVRTLQTVADQNVTARRIRNKAVFIGRIDVVKCIFSSADIQRIAVGQKRFAAEFFDNGCNGFGIVRTEKSEVARFAEMQLDGGVLVFKIDLVNTRRMHEPLELLQKIQSGLGAQVGVIYFGRSHNRKILFLLV